MSKRILGKFWPEITVKWATAFNYIGLAISLEPHYFHVLFLLVAKGHWLIHLAFMDAIIVAHRLQVHPDFHKRVVSKSKRTGRSKNSRGTKIRLAFGFYVVFLDIGRHYLLVLTLVSPDINFTLNVTNPFSGDTVAFSNVELATALFWTSFLHIGILYSHYKTLRTRDDS